jgi:tRNAThr (cytosine32-N3)-methyltransferase
MVFVLSAVKPDLMRHVILNLGSVMKAGGSVLFRDYGLYDMTQMRFIYKKERKLGESYYVRADGTRVFYFTTGKKL